MLDLTKTYRDPSGIVSKLVFEDQEAIAETVAYKYEDRGVICLSVQSGCNIGCSFCGTGKKFIRDLTVQEMFVQFKAGLKEVGDKSKIQVMAMSMGEPMDNWNNVSGFVTRFFMDWPQYHFYVSTVGLKKFRVLHEFVMLGNYYKNFGLQFSLHNFDNEKRKTLLGNHPRLADLQVLYDFGQYWTTATGKRCYWNYICKGDEGYTESNRACDNLDRMHLTCSVLCNTKGLIKADSSPATKFADKVIKTARSSSRDVEVSVFDPAGQDTIGGGCGQLLYVQKKLTGECS